MKPNTVSNPKMCQLILTISVFSLIMRNIYYYFPNQKTDITIFLCIFHFQISSLVHRKNNTKIYPANAGIISNHFVHMDHPRSRGEYKRISRQNHWYVGSPPLARGIHQTPAGIAAVAKITPARAGNTQEMALQLSFKWDHPRSRGEY